jgi:hypothetical protein
LKLIGALCFRQYQLNSEADKHGGAEPVQSLVCRAAAGEKLAEGSGCHSYSAKYNDNEYDEDYPKNNDLAKKASRVF